MSFSADITRFVAKTNGNIDIVVRKITLDIFRNVVKRTPVDTGRARAGWQIEETLHSIKVNKDDPTGQRTIREARQLINAIRAGGVIYVLNNVEYILPLEYGSSKQAPNGMARLTVQLYTRFLNNAVRSLK